MKKEDRLLRIGVLGCGPIAQIAHFDSIKRARNATLYALCDRADDLRERMAVIHEPTAVYADYDAMLADPQVEAIIVAVADQFHVALCQKALAAGKHVLVEKPMGVSVEECEQLRATVAQSGRILQVGYNKRFDPGLATGESACPFTTLYWDFLARHETRLAKNPRMVMQVKNLSRHSAEQRAAVAQRAQAIRAGEVVGA